MRRREREITEMKEILAILEKADTIRLGIQGETCPYIVPVSFALDKAGEKCAIYFHSAKAGLKVELLQHHPQVCFECDTFIKVEKTAYGITTRYESVIGFGKCTVVEEPDEIQKGLKLLTEHYGYADYPLERCGGLPHVNVYKILVDSVTGKRNLPVENE